MSNDAVRPWFDDSLPVEERLELLLAEMTLEEKSGQLFHAMITAGPDGALADAQPAFGLPSNAEFIDAMLIQRCHFVRLPDAVSCPSMHA